MHIFFYYCYEIRENHFISPWISKSPEKTKENFDEAILVIHAILFLESDKHILSVKFHAGYLCAVMKTLPTLCNSMPGQEVNLLPNSNQIDYKVTTFLSPSHKTPSPSLSLPAPPRICSAPASLDQKKKKHWMAQIVREEKH